MLCSVLARILLSQYSWKPPRSRSHHLLYLVKIPSPTGPRWGRTPGPPSAGRLLGWFSWSVSLAPHTSSQSTDPPPSVPTRPCSIQNGVQCRPVSEPLLQWSCSFYCFPDVRLWFITDTPSTSHGLGAPTFGARSLEPRSALCPCCLWPAAGTMTADSSLQNHTELPLQDLAIVSEPRGVWHR